MLVKERPSIFAARSEEPLPAYGYDFLWIGIGLDEWQQHRNGLLCEMQLIARVTTQQRALAGRVWP